MYFNQEKALVGAFSVIVKSSRSSGADLTEAVTALLFVADGPVTSRGRARVPRVVTSDNVT